MHQLLHCNSFTYSLYTDEGTPPPPVNAGLNHGLLRCPQTKNQAVYAEKTLFYVLSHTDTDTMLVVSKGPMRALTSGTNPPSICQNKKKKHGFRPLG
jgi:hypothetical protein